MDEILLQHPFDPARITSLLSSMLIPTFHSIVRCLARQGNKEAHSNTRRVAAPKVRTGVVIITLALFTHSSSADPLMVTYPMAESANDPRVKYPAALLKAVLDRCGRPYVLRQSSLSMQQGRAVQELAKGNGDLSIVWTMTTIERERLLRPIRVPIDRGLFGWRVAVIRAEDFDLFKRVKRTEELGDYQAGLGHDWPDVAIFRAANIPIVTATSYESLFSMLEARRFDYLPRSVLEVMPEVSRRRALGLTVESRLLIKYPTAIYFFVRRSDGELSELVSEGLESAISDGSFNRIFYEYFGADIERLNLASRTTIALPNPTLPSRTPFWRRELWFRPNEVHQSDREALPQ